MITTAADLQDLVSTLHGATRVAVDTEADSLHCYHEKLCLIQISVPGLDVLVDPLAGLDLSPLYKELGEHCVILHGADFDLRMLRRAGFDGVPDVFDTVIAARLTGHTEFSLAALVQKYFGIELSKGAQKSNWGQRPLTPRMIEYAMNDTRYLHTIAEKLEQELVRLGRLDWFQQSCRKVVNGSLVDRERDLDRAWRITGSHELRDRAEVVLRELWLWREKEAEMVDRPPFHILQNSELLEFAKKAANGEPVHAHRLNGNRRDRFILSLERAMSLPESEWPKRIFKARLRPTAAQDKQLRDMKSHRDRISGQLNLDPSLIAPKATLEAIAYQGVAPSELLLPWQLGLMRFPVATTSGVNP